MFAKVRRINTRSVLVLITLLFSALPRAHAQSWTWTNQIIDVEGDDSWIVVDHDGNLHVSYRHPTGAQLKYAFLPAGGDRWFNTTLDDMQGDFQTRIAVNDQGNPYICYTPKTLKFALFDGQRWTKQPIDPGIGTVNYYCSVRVGRDGNPQVSWYVESGVYLRYAVLRDGAWEAMNIDAQDTPGKFNSLILDANGNPHVSYIALLGCKLRYAHRDGKQWIRSTIDGSEMNPEGGDRGMGNSIALDKSGNPIISYMDTVSLKVAHLVGGRWKLETIDHFPQLLPWSWRNFRSTILIDSKGNPHIGYETILGVKHAWWDGTQWRTQLLLAPGGSTYDGGMAIDANDTLYMTYSNPMDHSLRLAVGRFGAPQQTAQRTK